MSTKIQITNRTKKYVGIAIVLFALLYATLPFTIYRGWGYPDMIAWVINRIPFVHANLTPAMLYQWEAKALAHTFDVLLVIFLIVLGLIIHSIFSKKEEETQNSNIVNIGKVNQEIRSKLNKIKKINNYREVDNLISIISCRYDLRRGC